MVRKDNSDGPNILAWLFWISALGALTVYVIRAFNPEQPLHHELNEAGGVFLAACLIFLGLSFMFD